MSGTMSLGQFAGVYTPPERIAEVSEALPGEGYEHRAVVRSLAASTVPAKHLRGLAEIRTDDPIAQGEGAVSGYYRDAWPEPGHEPHKPDIGIAGTFKGAGKAERAKRQYALLHEVGHHVHAERNESDFLFGNNRRNEGVADNFAEKHHTSRIRHETVNGETADSASTLGEKRWARSYRAARDRGMMPERMPRPRQKQDREPGQ